MKKCAISEYYLERYVLGELPDEDIEEIRQSAATDLELQTVLKEIESSNRDILSLYPSSTVKASLQERMNETQNTLVDGELLVKSFPLRRILYISSAFVTAVVIIFLVFPRSKEETGIIPGITTEDFALVKGIQNIDLSKTQLLVFRKNYDQVEILESGELASKGDLLQLAYIAAKEPYGVIFSIDGRGSITLHFPAEKNASTSLDQNKKSLLPHAMELDDAPDFERFFFITSESPIAVEDILRKAEKLAKDPARFDFDLPEGLKQYTILILKGEGS